MSDEKKTYPTVAVLMSTYNGEKYLKEQIDSIIRQKNVNINLFIRDDGSKDKTLKIIEDYTKKFKNIHLLESEGNLGPGKSFMTLMYQVGKKEVFDYLAFSDQDDIWLPRKMEKAIDRLEESGTNRPVLYTSNQILYQDGSPVGLRYKEKQDLTLCGHIHRNTISGCTFVMNKILAKKICQSPWPKDEVIARRMHDSWIILAAIVVGKAIYDQNAYILYRIHEDNVVGIKKLSVKDKINNIQRNLEDKQFANYRMKTAKQLLVSFPEVSGRKRDILEEYAFYQQSKEMKKKLLKDKEVYQNNGHSVLLFKLKILLNIV